MFQAPVLRGAPQPMASHGDNHPSAATKPIRVTDTRETRKLNNGVPIMIAVTAQVGPHRSVAPILNAATAL